MWQTEIDSRQFLQQKERDIVAQKFHKNAKSFQETNVIPLQRQSKNFDFHF